MGARGGERYGETAKKELSVMLGLEERLGAGDEDKGSCHD